MSTCAMVYALTHHKYTHTVITKKTKVKGIRQKTTEGNILVDSDLQFAGTYICPSHLPPHTKRLRTGPKTMHFKQITR